MDISEHVSLAGYSTMGLGGAASYLVEITSRDEVLEALEWAKAHRQPTLMIGGGSNIVWRDEGFQGLVIVNRIPGYEANETADGTRLLIGAGENWDSVVERSVQTGLTGIEALSLIPGSAGATPIQNVGAYGQEISQSLDTVEAYDTRSGDFITLPGSDCGFGYRTSRFKTNDRGRFYITGLSLRLKKGRPAPPFYGQVQAWFDEHGIKDYTPAALRQAVVAIRSAKLPDPAKVRNTGSFFANPLVEQTKYEELAKAHDSVPHWTAGNSRVKLSAAWLIQEAGFKDYHDAKTGMGTWPRQPLVLVNEKAKKTADLLAFKQQIVDAVNDKFGITLEQEPEMLP